MQGVKDTQLLKIVKSVVMYVPIAQNYIQSGHSLIVQPLGMRDEIKILN